MCAKSEISILDPCQFLNQAVDMFFNTVKVFFLAWCVFLQPASSGFSMSSNF